MERLRPSQIQMLMKSKYLRRYRGPNGEWVYIYKEGGKDKTLSFLDNADSDNDPIKDAVKAILADGEKNGFDWKKTLSMAQEAAAKTNRTEKEKKKMALDIVKRAVEEYEGK
ncbi:MAG: hypothetical protein C4K49_10655 [Candidatus Thorarchaeota archaeon]|nr:MAG: hypothetical protein C4K49_10655 [Candidatus Thorarchaeota archaeon]